MKFIIERSLQGFILGSFLKQEEIAGWVSPHTPLREALSVATNDFIVYLGNPYFDGSEHKYIDTLPPKYIILPTVSLETYPKEFHLVNTNKEIALYQLANMEGIQKVVTDKDLLLQIATTMQANSGIDYAKWELARQNPLRNYNLLMAYYMLMQDQAKLDDVQNFVSKEEITSDIWQAAWNYNQERLTYLETKEKTTLFSHASYKGTDFVYGTISAERYMNEVAMHEMALELAKGRDNVIIIVQKYNLLLILMNEDNENIMKSISDKYTGSHGRYMCFLNGINNLALHEGIKATLEEDTDDK